MNQYCFLVRMVLALSLLGLVVSCVQKQSGTAKPHVAIVTNGVAAFWTIAQAGAAEGAQEQPGTG